MDASQGYFTKPAAAFVRGALPDCTIRSWPGGLYGKSLDALTREEMAEILARGQDEGLRIHRFKRTMGLPRVSKVLGILQGIRPAELLDIGSGRGAFLWPLLDTFPDLAITALDRDPQRARQLQSVRRGGYDSLTAARMSATALGLAGGSFDVVTLLEVLEHIPDADAALAEAVRVARRFVVLSVPSREDDNPGHIHLFSRESLERMLNHAGAARWSFTYVHGHVIVVARKGGLVI